MSRLSKKLTNKFSFLLICFILLFYSTSQSSEKVDELKIQKWIENIPILSILIDNKTDVVEFDSSNGKIISISFEIKDKSKKQIISFYEEFFEEKKWKKDPSKNLWETNGKTFKKKIFKIENLEINTLVLKIIVENF